jgi:hypothetical protein
MKLFMISATLLVSGFMGLASTPAAAQTASKSAQAIPSWYTSSGACPSGWRQSGRMCENTGSGAAMFPLASSSARCPTGFGRFNSRPFCSEGADTEITRSATNTLTKTNALDRCPIPYFTNVEAPMTCITQVSNPPTVRAKGSVPCPAGSVEDWGVWCISNYANLTRVQASTVVRDWNAIYSTSHITTGRQQEPRQPDLPGASSYSPAYITIFGRVKEDGTPFDGAASAAAAAPAAPLVASGRGSMNPQARNDVAFLCPEGWAGRPTPGDNKCYPGPGALPAYPPQREGEPCAAGHVISSTWCVNVGGAQAQTGAQAQAQTPANCPPAGGAAQQAGAALGGLLGGRRGNSQAGAALGGLLGAAAGAAKPAGCP